MQNSVPLKFRNVFETLPGLYLILFPDLRIAAVTDAYLEATMTERDKILSRGIFEVFPDNPHDPHANGESNLRTSLNLVLERRTPHMMAIQKYDIRTPDGSFEERYWSPKNIPVLDDQQVAFIIHCVEDVTEFILTRSNQERQILESKQLREQIAEKDLKLLKHIKQIEDINKKLQSEIASRKKSDELFSRLFESNPASIAISRMQDAKIIEVNEAFLSIFGFNNKDEVLGKTASELNIVAHPEQRDQLIKLLDKDSIVKDFEIKTHTKQGNVFWVSTSALIIEVGGIPCLFSISIDISKRKKMEEELQSLNHELETFSYSVSHDLRSPLRSIDAYARILEEDYAHRLEAEGKKVISTITRNAERMGRLIDNMLNLSRQGKIKLSVGIINMNLEVDRVLSELLVATSHRNIQIHKDELHPCRADLDMIRQVWTNIISNAIKYTSKKDEARIEIGSSLKQDEVCYYVKDNGAGFDSQYAHKLFDVFQRLHSLNEFEGTGVGLATCKRIIERHGGKVWAEGVKDKGATFYFSLPERNASNSI
jgi:PAS domain S-box-containing protein